MKKSSYPFRLAVVLCAALLAVAGPAAAETAHPAALMAEYGHGVRAGINDLVRKALLQTQLLAAEPELIQAVTAGETIPLVDLANLYIMNSPVLDVVAFFDEEGGILAMNTQDSQGKLLAKEKIDEIMRKRFVERGVIADCLTNKAVDSLVEFQTHCDFTPELYNSSGLSVALSSPIVDPDTGAKVGVISTRLNFQRVLDVVEGRRFSDAKADVFLVSDAGEYFSEPIQSGLVEPPVAPEVIRALSGPFEYTDFQNIFAEDRDDYLTLVQINIREMVPGKNLYILVRAPKDAVEEAAAMGMRPADKTVKQKREVS
ncbi:MAG: hypothetical protein HQL11_00870 [Candidatus Omnitrophica bacterium]|nr:hypothetical protein [Candidatus Omnitrophota bacterium]